MRRSLAVPFLHTLCVLCALLVPIAAWAQKVVVLGFEGDSDGQLRAQLEAAIRKGNQVELVSASDYEDRGRQHGLKPEQVRSPESLQTLGPELGVAAALTGTVGERITVHIVDAEGKQLWSKDLPARQGRLSPDHARRLASAVAAASHGPNFPTAAKRSEPPVAVADPGPPAPLKVDPPPPHLPAPPPAAPLTESPPEPIVVPRPAVEPMPRASAPAVEASPQVSPRVLPPPALDPVAVPPPAASEPPLIIKRTRPKSMRPPGELDFQRASAPPGVLQPMSKSATKPKRPVSHAVAPFYGPHYFKIELGALGTLRSYCARPGVSGSCAAYDVLALGSRPAGPTADFSWQNPYPGGVVSAEVFPLAKAEQPYFRGLGVLGGYARGWSTTTQPSLTAGGQSTTLPVSSIDERWWVMAAARYYFGFGGFDPVAGYVGLRVGYQSRAFVPDRPADVFLPGTHRHLWAFGLDLLIPVNRWVKIEIGALYYFNAGVATEDAVELGQQTGSFGLSAWGGLSGEIAGPLGYFVRGEWARFNEVFAGPGTQWPSGGFAGETYVTASGGLSLGF